MGGFSNGNQEYKVQNKGVFDTGISTANYVKSNGSSSSDSTKKTTADTETVDLDGTTGKNYSGEADTSKSSGEATNVKAEEVTDFSYKQYDNSVIEEYLKTCGDVNGDGKIDSKDVKMLQEGLAGSKDISKGDVDGDGEVTVKDATLLQKYVEGGGYVPPTIEIANKLDQIKYEKTKTAVEKELHEKYAERKEIDSSIKYHNKVNQKKKNTPTHSNDSGWHSGYVGGKKKKNKKKTDADYFPGGCEANERNKYFYERYKATKASDAKEAKYKKEYGSLGNARDFYDSNIASLNYEKQQLDKQIKLTPYDNMMATAEFKKWSNNHTIDDFDPTKNDKLKNNIKYMVSYKYLNVYQLSMYNYLLDTKNEDAANEYLDILEDDINRQKGYEKAQTFAKRLDKNFSKIIKEDGSLMDDKDVAAADKLYNEGKYDKKYDMDGDGDLDKDDLTKLNQYIETGGEITASMKNLKISFDQGFDDGIIKFCEGIKNMFVNSDTLSVEEYKMMFIAQMLEQNGIVKGSYEFGSTVGNMVPVIVASAIMTAATAPFGGEGGALFAVGSYTVTASTVGKMTAATLIFASTYGNSKHEALVNGHSLESAVGYGVLSGISEAGLETLLGSIPFVGKESRSLLVSMFREGLSESAQELASSVIGYYTLGEEIDVSQLSADMGKAFVYGAMLSGIGNVGKGVANMKVLVNGVKYELTGAQIMEYYKASTDPKTGKSNGLTLQQYILQNIDPSSGDIDVVSKYGLNESQSKQFLNERNKAGFTSSKDFITQLQKDTGFASGADPMMMIEVKAAMAKQGIKSLTGSNGFDKKAFSSIYKSLSSYEAKKAFYTECVVKDTFHWDSSVREYIASSMYADETGGKSFYDMSLKDRNAYIDKKKNDIDNLTPAERAVYEKKLTASRTDVAEGTIKRIEWLESQGHLKKGYTAEQVLGMVMDGEKPETYLSESYVKEYWSKWNPDSSGNIKVVCFGSADVGAAGPTKFGAGVGIPGEGAFVMSYDFYQSLCKDSSLHNADGSWNTTALMNRLGGVKIGEQPVAIVQDVNISDMQMPNGGMNGAYIGDWTPGGFTSSGQYVTNADGSISLQNSALEGVAPPTSLFMDDGSFNSKIQLELLSPTQKADYVARAAKSLLDNATNSIDKNGLNSSNSAMLQKAINVYKKQGYTLPSDASKYVSMLS